MPFPCECSHIECKVNRALVDAKQVEAKSTYIDTLFIWELLSFRGWLAHFNCYLIFPNEISAVSSYSPPYTLDAMSAVSIRSLSN